MCIRDRLATNVPGTYGSIIDTIRHTVGADAAYLFVLTGGGIARIDEEEEAQMDVAELRARMAEHGPAWTAFLRRDIDPTLDVVRFRCGGPGSADPVTERGARLPTLFTQCAG